VSSDLLYAYRVDEGAWTPYSNVTTHVFQKLSAGNHVLEVLTMDRNGNKAPTPGRLEFAIIVPWLHDPRLVSVSILALFACLVLAALAVNSHIELKRSYAHVEQMVEDRTRELDLANKELLHSQKMRALGTMAAGIAHDFNNILSIIKGSAQIIENNVQDPEKIRTRVSRIQTVVEQGTVIVKALLGLGKTEQKDLSDCDLQDILHQTRKLLSDRFPETVQFQINVGPDVPVVHCAPEVLQQILLNLVINAAEAMHNEGIVELNASIVRTLPPKAALQLEAAAETGVSTHYVLISVLDQGGGIPAEILPRIFEPFFTTKAFSSRRGTGLGLSMVYELAKAQGYGLAVETKMGEGSTFTIILPVLTKSATG
jgi:signal transduction histidine kinase